MVEPTTKYDSLSSKDLLTTLNKVKLNIQKELEEIDKCISDPDIDSSKKESLCKIKFEIEVALRSLKDFIEIPSNIPKQQVIVSKTINEEEKVSHYPNLSEQLEIKPYKLDIFEDSSWIKFKKVLSNNSIRLSRDYMNMLSETPIFKYLGDYGITFSGLKPLFEDGWILAGSTMVHIIQKIVGDLRWEQWKPQDIDFFKIVNSRNEISELKSKISRIQSICVPIKNYMYRSRKNMHSFYVNLQSGLKLNFTIVLSESEPTKHIQELSDLKICSASFSKKGFEFPPSSEEASLESMKKSKKLKSEIDHRVRENFIYSVKKAGLDPSGLKLTAYDEYQKSKNVVFNSELKKKLNRIVKYQNRGIEIIGDDI